LFQPQRSQALARCGCLLLGYPQQEPLAAQADLKITTNNCKEKLKIQPARPQKR